eukprot:14087107-Heterocapsa_arctica.AAC.1
MSDEDGATDDCAPGADYADDDLFQEEEASCIPKGPREPGNAHPIPNRAMTRGRARQEAQTLGIGADLPSINLGIGIPGGATEQSTNNEHPAAAMRIQVQAPKTHRQLQLVCEDNGQGDIVQLSTEGFI